MCTKRIKVYILVIKKVDTAKDCGELDYKHINDDNETDTNWFHIAKRLNIKLPIINVLMIGQKAF